jgi:hypothetical protein
MASMFSLPYKENYPEERLTVIILTTYLRIGLYLRAVARKKDHTPTKAILYLSLNFRQPGSEMYNNISWSALYKIKGTKFCRCKTALNTSLSCDKASVT